MESFAFQKNKYVPILTLNGIISPHARMLIAMIFRFLFFIALIVWVYNHFSPLLVLPGDIHIPTLSISTDFLKSIMLIAGGFWLTLSAMARFVSSKMTSALHDAQSENIAKRFSFYATELWYHAIYGPKAKGDIGSLLHAIPLSQAGSLALLRLGIPVTDFQQFLLNYTSSTASPISSNLPAGVVSLGDILFLLFEADVNFREFLQNKQITKDALVQTAEWVEAELIREQKQQRWWSWENLARVPGLAKTWGYGPTFTIQQFGYDLRREATSMPYHLVGREKQIKLLESALLKAAGANVVIVRDP